MDFNRNELDLLLIACRLAQKQLMPWNGYRDVGLIVGQFDELILRFERERALPE